MFYQRGFKFYYFKTIITIYNIINSMKEIKFFGNFDVYIFNIEANIPIV